MGVHQCQIVSFSDYLEKQEFLKPLLYDMCLVLLFIAQHSIMASDWWKDWMFDWGLQPITRSVFCLATSACLQVSSIRDTFFPKVQIYHVFDNVYAFRSHSGVWRSPPSLPRQSCGGSRVMTLWGLYQWAILKEIQFLTFSYICDDISLNNSPI